MKLLKTLSLVALSVLMIGVGAHADALQDAVTDHAALNFAAAIPLYQTAIQQGNPVQRKQAEFLLASCYWSDQQLDNAANEFLTYAKDFPGDANSLVAIIHAADIRRSQGQLDEAATLLNQVFATGDPSAPDAYTWTGWANLGEGQLQAAEKNYAQAIPYLMKAIQNASEGRVVGLAHDCLQQCVSTLQAAGQQTYAQQWLGESELAEGHWHVSRQDYPGAQPMLQQAIADLTAPGTLGEAQELLARTYLNTGKWPDCLNEAATAEKTLEQDPDANQIYASFLGKAYTYQARAYLELKQYQDCVNECEAMLANVPSPDAGELVESYLLEAKALKLMTRPLDAIAVYKRFRSSYPDAVMQARAGMAIASIYMRMRDEADAITSLNTCISQASGLAHYQAVMKYMLADCLLNSGSRTAGITVLQDLAGVKSPVQTLAQKRLATAQAAK